DLAFTIPLSAVPVILVGVILLAMFIAAGMMILASFARTFKEGQSMVTPFYLLTILPVVFLQTPGVEFTPVFALIPLVNVTMVFREAIAGVYHWPLIGLTLLVEALSVILCLKLAGVILHHEDVLMGGYAGSFSKFVRQRLFGGKAKSGGEKGGR
ncbi:MAG: hypothetical protein LBP68_02530, partial [Acidobacteriota bacterium]|nr:hypothetical protein [Acidobacteriota bacterium]